jgi:N-acetylmuramoyl-L-alanine amidase
MRALLALVFAGGCAAAVAATQAPQALNGILKVRFGGTPAETRIVVDLDRAVSAKILDTQARRIVVALPDVGASGVVQGRGQGLVKAWTLENRATGARLSLDLFGDAEIRRRFLLPPADGVSNYRYVIDVVRKAAPVRQAKAAATAPTLTPTAEDPVTLADAAPPALKLKKVIVIDAGHGGHDPGAQSATSNEKDITLAAARALKARLEKTGRYQVVMTRDSDTYVALDSRVQIARRAGADLFISLHADSAGDNTEAHGASVYTLSDQGSGRVTRVLDRNEWFQKTAARSGDAAVGQILLDLTQRSTRNRSAVFAHLLLDRINDRVELLPRSHRDAGYFVLLAPDVPAALLEMGFITSPDDQARLTNAAERGKLMDGVAEAIDAYFAAPSLLASR